ncbi:MAG: DMT family transporter [Duodenibacillus sp.]|nr:DMT family transporter [Duodenibacillus sp.]
MARQSLWMIAATFFFSVMFLLSKLCTAETGPFEIMFYRAAVGLAFVSVLMVRKGVSPRTRHPLAHLRRCACGLTAFGSELIALSFIPLAIEQTITYTGPLFFCLFLLVECLCLRLPIDRWLLAAAAVGFGGVLLIIRPDVAGINLTGTVFAFSGAFFAAAVGMCLRNLARYGEPTERTVFYFMLSGTLVGGIGTLATGGFQLHSPEVTALLVGVGIAGGIAQIMVTVAWTYGHALLNAVFQYTGILFAVVFGAIFFAERPDALCWLGMSVVCAAGIGAAIRQKKAGAA